MSEPAPRAEPLKVLASVAVSSRSQVRSSAPVPEHVSVPELARMPDRAASV